MNKEIEIPEGYEAQIENNKVIIKPKESEDERIRKTLLRCCYDWDRGRSSCVAKKDVPIIYAYLEKQKEQKIARWKSLGECSDIPDGHYVVGWFHSGDLRFGIMCNGLFVDTDGNRAEQPKEVFYIPNANEEFVYAEQKPVELDPQPESLEEGCNTTAGCIKDESEYDKGYRAGKAYQLRQTEQYKIGRTFMGLIPCWVNAPSELQPAHKYHGRNAVIMHENNGGFRCCFIDDAKATTVHLPEDTLFVEGWRKKPEGWSEDDENMYIAISIALTMPDAKGYLGEWHKTPEDADNWLKSLHPQPKQEDRYMEGYQNGFAAAEKAYNNAVSYHMDNPNIHKLDPNVVIHSTTGGTDIACPHWKPSEEQMEALKDAFRKDGGNEYRKVINSLYRDLEKLL